MHPLDNFGLYYNELRLTLDESMPDSSRKTLDRFPQLRKIRPNVCTTPFPGFPALSGHQAQPLCFSGESLLAALFFCLLPEMARHPTRLKKEK
jgi:hypothetical protein